MRDAQCRSYQCSLALGRNHKSYENILTPLPSIDYNIHSYEDILNMFPHLVSGQIKVGKTKQFTHSFIVANIKHAILGLDFLKFHNFVIDTAASKVDISNSTKENILTPLPSIDYNIHSYEDILNMFPHLVSGQIKVGKTKHPFEHVLEVDGPPIAFQPRRLNLEKTSALNKILDDMLEKNIISSTTSPWASPVL